MQEPRSKRRRSLSSSSSASAPSSRSHSPAASPAPKYHRGSPGPSNDPRTAKFTCNLPPTCSQPSTSTRFASEEDLVGHQNAFHRWICRTPIRNRHQQLAPGAVPETFVSKKKGYDWKECGKFFPDERLLNLHQVETHDPIARAKQDRGEKIFQCFVPPPECTKVFATPAKRRMHLVAKHKYPELYFFSITNHGLNRIAQEDGLGISMIRPRNDPLRPPKAPTANGARKKPPAQPITKQSTANRESSASAASPLTQSGEVSDVDMDGLVSSMESSLQFVPRGVRHRTTASPGKPITRDQIS